MTTLIEVRKGDGTLVGRCDARCYDAEDKRCDCICGGKNHGAGRARAMQNTETDLNKILRRCGGKKNVRWTVDVRQHKLFDQVSE